MATGQGVAYDAAGNVIAYLEGRTFNYDAENKQREVKDSLNQTIGQYFFDGDGKRIKKVVPGTGEVTIFVYDAGGKLIGEYSTIVETQAPKVKYLTNDHLGSPRINTDQDGNVVSRTDYMPYGEETIALGNRTTNENYVEDDVRQGFTGYENDAETELYYAKARMHNSGLGRFHSPDPLYFQFRMTIDPQVFNLYVYTRNNPQKWVDPNGETIYLRGNIAWLRQNVLYEMVGGEENFNRYFNIENGQVVLRDDIEICEWSNVNSGVQLLAEMVNADENYLYAAEDNLESALSHIDGLNALDRDRNAVVNPLSDANRRTAQRNFGSMGIVGLSGRYGTLAPSQLANGEAVFAALVFNTNGTGYTQTDVGFAVGINEDERQALMAGSVGEAQRAGIGQAVSSVSWGIHESSELLEFAGQRRSGQVYDYIRAHTNAQIREARIRRELGITGGFSGGMLRANPPR